MLRNKTIMGAILMIAAVYLLSGCYKDKTVILNTGNEITAPVSLAKDIIPIFSKSCNLSGCHNSGGQVPDLTAGKAYSSMINGNLIDIANPENSEIYGWLTGKIKPAMPISASTNPFNINALILAWIKQGGKNN